MNKDKKWTRQEVKEVSDKVNKLIMARDRK